MTNNHPLFLFALLILSFPSLGQNTVGTILNTENSYNGYTFFSPFSGTKAWLVDNCGGTANVWDRGTRPGLSAYFLDNGLMFRMYKINPVGPFTSASNAGGIELVDWDNNTVWSYEINTPTMLSHHDAVYMPNGNVLILVWELIFEEDLIAWGRDPNEIAQEGYMWSERVIELEPVGTNDANIVWEWKIEDHYIQQFDPAKANYGVISEHPELFNINLPELSSSNSNSTRDWNHFNAIDYHPELDQILISTRNSDEIWILDHSTTTEEAATHEGGLYGKGGDILYRWGNAFAYNRAPVSSQKLFGQHGVHWIREGLTDTGKIMIFNNGNGRPGPDFSQVDIIVPPQDENGGYIVPETAPFGPSFTDWTYGNGSSEDYYSPYLSNAQRLPNGNTLINPGSTGVIFEIDANRNKVWEYVIPLYGDSPAIQGGNVSNNSTFRAYRFGPDFSGFEGLELAAGSTIELGNDQNGCMLAVDTEEEVFVRPTIEVKYSPIDQSLQVDYPDNLQTRIFLVDVAGRQTLLKDLHANDHFFPLSNIGKGIYFVQVVLESDEIYSQKILVY